MNCVRGSLCLAMFGFVLAIGINSASAQNQTAVLEFVPPQVTYVNGSGPLIIFKLPPGDTGRLLLVIYREKKIPEVPAWGTVQVHVSDSGPGVAVPFYPFTDSTGLVGYEHWAVGYKWNAVTSKWDELARSHKYKFTDDPNGGGGDIPPPPPIGS